VNRSWWSTFVTASLALTAGLFLLVHAVRHGETDALLVAAVCSLALLPVVARIHRLRADVGALRAAEARLRASEAALREAQHLASLGSWSMDLRSGELTLSDELRRILGLRPEQPLTGGMEQLARLVHPDDRQRLLELVGWSIGARVPFEAEYRVVRADGAVRVVQGRGELLASDADGPRTMVGTAQDITERSRAQQSAHLLVSIVESSRDAILAVAPDWTVTSWNAGAEALLDLPATEAVGRPVTTSWPPDRVAPDTAALERAFGGEVVADLETVRLRRDGTRVPVAFTWSPITDGSGRVTGVSVIGRDITERKRLEGQLVEQALHDPLTRLANRTLFQDRLSHALSRAARQGERLAVLLVDLDDFKLVNEGLGHAAGDRLLVAVAGRMAGAVRAADTVARLGGDEFGVLLEAVEPGQAAATAERLLATLAGPVDLGGTQVFAAASIGIIESGGGGDASDLLRDADVAMYAAKAKGERGYAVFDASMREAALDRLELDAELRQAIDAGQFEVHYQPIVALASGEVASFEALLRWRHPERGMIGPDQFVPSLERSGLIVPVGRWVLQQACAQLAQWRARSGRLLSVSVNVSPRQIREAGFVDQVAAVLAATGLPADALVVEITEGVVIADAEGATARLRAIRELGARVAVDDFGTGYSSLRYLQAFPVDVVKVDRSFIAEMHHGPAQLALARAIVKIGHALRLAVVAEGVETAEQAAYLREIGCQYGQGYLFARPEPAAAVEARLVGPPAPVRAARGR
jgi:diguanylate cyclase (GGDEF)-like protein/PAS domain S-box-containing protein